MLATKVGQDTTLTVSRNRDQPVPLPLRAGGVIDLRGIAQALKDRGVRTARGALNAAPQERCGLDSKLVGEMTLGG